MIPVSALPYVGRRVQLPSLIAALVLGAAFRRRGCAACPAIARSRTRESSSARRCSTCSCFLQRSEWIALCTEGLVW